MSKYQDAGGPKTCFLPSCQKAFESSCYRGKDDHYYCSEKCAQEGFDEHLDVVEVLPKRFPGMA